MNTIPSPETLRPLLEAALAVMEPNDPARENINVRACLPADGSGFFSVSFYRYSEQPHREAYGAGRTAEEALEAFKEKYTPPLTKKDRIAALRAELAKMEAGQ